MRLLLVLVLALDQLSAPFHSHAHEGLNNHGPAALHVDLHDDSHADDVDDQPASHAVAAIKVEATRIATLPLGHAVQAAPPSAALLVTATLESSPERWRPDRARPDFRSQRSLPPAGRAPPLHA